MPLPQEYEPRWYEGLFARLEKRIDYTNDILTSILGQLGGVAPGVPPITPITLENPEFIKAQQKLVKTAGIAVQMPSALIPYDKEVIIKALGTNIGTIYIAPTKTDAEGHTSSFSLAPGEAIGYKIKNLNQIWIDASVSGEGVDWTVEQEAS